MIKFFRKIRQRLLTENKFSKYLLYALGEIVLVVIGILIALQVNNLNQNRLNDKKEHIILKQFIEDLEQDASNLSIAINTLKEINKVAHFFYTELKFQETTNDTINYNFFGSAIRIPLSFKERNQEYVNQVNNPVLRNSLSEYLFLEEIYKQGIIFSNNFVRNTVRQYLGNNGAHNLDYVFTKNSIDEIFSEPNSIYRIDQIKELLSENSFESILFQIRINALSVIKNGNTLMEKNKDLIQELKARTN